MTIRNAVKTELEKIAQAEGAVLTSKHLDLILTIPEGEGMELVFAFHHGADRDPYCSTNYTAQGKHFTFDRRGVDDSFYFESAEKLQAQVTEQRQRVKDSQARLAQTTPFNLGPVTLMLSPERLADIVAKIKSTSYRYHPSGFGTGYVFSTNPRIRNPYDRATASQELVKLVGAPVYISSFDAD